MNTGIGDVTGDAASAAEDSLGLFSGTHRSNDELEVSGGPITRIGMEDLLNSEIGKNDYDWLLTPPETPLYPAVARESPLSSATIQSPLSSTAPGGRTNVRPVSNTRASRLSAAQKENGHSARPVRSSSVTCPSISNTYSRSSLSNNNRIPVLNTSSAFVTSSRSSTPNRSTTSRPSAKSTSTSTTTARPSQNSTTSKPSSNSRSLPSRLTTPPRTQSNPSTSGERTTSTNNSRPSTTTSSQPKLPSNPNPNSRASSRSSTPTCRPTSSAGLPVSNVGSRVPSRPSSPGLRARAPVRPVDLPNFPVDAPPNLKTKMPERPASAGSVRPGAALDARANSNSNAGSPAKVACPANSNRRTYMPVMNRSRVPENSLKDTFKSNGNNGHEEDSVSEIQKLAGSEGVLRKPAKPASATESTGFGRTISKKSLDMALRHMDIRQGMGGIRASSIFPQSIRSTTIKNWPSLKSDPVVPLVNDKAMTEIGSYNGAISPDCRSSIIPSENGDLIATSKPLESVAVINGSFRYDAFILKEEDSKNMNWLHSVEDKSDQSPVFDHRFEPLPEPFDLL